MGIFDYLNFFKIFTTAPAEQKKAIAGGFAAVATILAAYNVDLDGIIAWLNAPPALVIGGVAYAIGHVLTFLAPRNA